MKEYKYYLFDFDGTLANTYEEMKYIFSDILSRYNIKITEKDIPYLLRNSAQSSFIEYGGKKEQLDAFISEIYQEVRYSKYLDKVSLYNDVIPLITHLKKKHKKIGVVTSNDIDTVKNVFKFLGLDDKFFDAYIGAREIKNFKPHPESILKCINVLSQSPKKDEFCYIGDSYNDFLAAKNASIDGYLLDRYNEYNDINDNKIHTLLELII